MKKTFLTMLFMVVAMGAFAQMQVWSNGTIIFSHNTNDVDSISFAGAPMRVQANTQAESVTSLAGYTFVNYNSSNGSNYIVKTIAFIDETTGILTEQGSSNWVDHSTYFTYVYNAPNLTITPSVPGGSRSSAFAAVVVGTSSMFIQFGTNALTLYPFYRYK